MPQCALADCASALRAPAAAPYDFLCLLQPQGAPDDFLCFFWNRQRPEWDLEDVLGGLLLYLKQPQ